MAIRIQFRRDVAADWSANNPILAEGELGLELDTNKYKLGDGINPWNSLNYPVLSNVSSYQIKNIASYTILNTDESVENIYAGATFTLPAAPALGQRHTIYNDTTSGVLTVEGNGKNINGGTSIELREYDSAILQYNGTQWRIS